MSAMRNKARSPFFCPSFALLLAFLAIFTTPISSSAQGIDVESLIRQRQVDCQEVALSTTALLQEFHQKQQHDTLQALMYYWESHCGMQEPMMRFLILHMIETNTFYEDWYPKNMLRMLDDYRLNQQPGGYPEYYFDYSAWEYYSLHPSFNQYTRDLAQRLKDYQDLTTLEYFFLEFYANRFREADGIQQSDFLQGSRLDSLIRGRQQELLAMPRRFLSFSGGLWKPTGNLNAVGSHPELGFAYEFQQNGVLLNTYINIAFGNAPRNYEVVVDNYIYSTRIFMGLALGLDLGIPLAHTQTTSFFLMPGIALRGFESLNTDPEHNYDVPANFIGSFSPNLGLYLRERLSSNGHMGVQLRYNFVNFRNSGGTDLAGNVFTVAVVFGFNY